MESGDAIIEYILCISVCVVHLHRCIFMMYIYIYIYIYISDLENKWRFAWSVHMYIYQRFAKGGHVCTDLDLLFIMT